MQQRSEETRSLILSTAAKLISKQGYAATGVAEICASAGVSKGAFYYHFPTKQALFLDLLDQWLSGLDITFETLRQDSGNVPEALRAMAQIAGNVLQSSDSERSIILEFWIQAYRDPAIWQAAIAPYQRYVRYFAELFQEGVEEGSFISLNPDAAARVTVALGMGILLQALFDQENMNWDDEVLKSVDYLLYGLNRR